MKLIVVWFARHIDIWNLIELLAQKICQTLRSKADMLDEYFSLRIDVEGHLNSLPVLLPGYVPNLEKLPLCTSSTHTTVVSCSKGFLGNWSDWPSSVLLGVNDTLITVLIRIALACNWKEEMGCFTSFLRELAFFYVPARSQSESENQQIEDQIKEKIFPAIRSYLDPPKSLWDQTRLTTSLPELYKVFER